MGREQADVKNPYHIHSKLSEPSEATLLYSMVIAANWKGYCKGSKYLTKTGILELPGISPSWPFHHKLGSQNQGPYL